MRIFITGGTGFIGTHLVKKLRQDKNNELFLSSVNLADIGKGAKLLEKELSSFNPDFVVHLAWEGLPNYGSEMSIKNLNYGLNLMNLLAKLQYKNVLMAGTSWEILPQPFNAISAAKTALHWLGGKIAQENNMNFIWARLFFVYGPGQKESSLIPYLLNCKKAGQKPEIKNPDAENDFIYVEDVAEAMSMIIKKCRKSAVYDIGSGQVIKVGEIAKIIFPDFEAPQLEISLAPYFRADISKIKKEIGWEPKTSIKQGIDKLKELSS